MPLALKSRLGRRLSQIVSLCDRSAAPKQRQRDFDQRRTIVNRLIKWQCNFQLHALQRRYPDKARRDDGLWHIGVIKLLHLLWSQRSCEELYLVERCVVDFNCRLLERRQHQETRVCVWRCGQHAILINTEARVVDFDSTNCRRHRLNAITQEMPHKHGLWNQGAHLQIVVIGVERHITDPLVQFDVYIRVKTEQFKKHVMLIRLQLQPHARAHRHIKVELRQERTLQLEALNVCRSGNGDQRVA